ncbi:MAG TPA: sigma 54-interacting transcriptional regulator [Terriglobales bacterium]|nr:sigma 54-interacting transcriptional regulator [Terriglobales bacterium]
MADEPRPAPDLAQALTDVAVSLRDDLPPHQVLAALSAVLQPVLPHDRLVVDHLDENGRTFRVFAEHVARGPVLHAEHYTIDTAREARYTVADWAIRRVFAGGSFVIADFATDPRYANPNPFEQRLADGGVRAGVVVPLRSGGRVIGAFVATSLAADVYREAHLPLAQRVADSIAPAVDNAVLRQRERRRRERLQVLEALPVVLGSTLNVTEVFARVADVARPAMDFDVMGVALLSANGREVEVIAEVNPGDEDVPPTPPRIPIDDFTIPARVLSGEPIVVHDAPAELDPSRAGDRLIIDAGARAVMAVPLRFGERIGGCLYFSKRRANWFDASDVEIGGAISAQVVLAIQHQRLGEQHRRLAHAEVRAKHLEERLDALRGELGERYGFERIVGRAPALRDVLQRAAKVAPTETTVLLTGESGTGKELVARAIHHASTRSNGPFVAVNCAALTDTLLESELFGHEKGAFTGADRQRPGRFEQAQGGTLFLDEVGELSAAVQAKLLRVLQEREFQRVGGTVTLRADVRLVAATNRNLEHEVASGRFRDDLFYRLNVFAVPLPPLRERGDDVLLLADYFVREIGARMGKGEPGLARDARDVLLRHAWPGNIRELSNAIERALIVSDGGLISAAQLAITAPVARAVSAPAPATSQSLADWEKQMVIDALASARGNKSRAASILGLTRSQLYTRLKRFDLV